MARLDRASLQRIWKRYQAIVWLALGLGFAGLFLIQSGDDLRSALPIVQQANPVWILAAIACQLLIIVCLGERFRVVFGWMGAALSLPTLIRAYLRRSTLTSIVPLGGPVGLLRFVRDLEENDVPAPTTLYGSFLAAISNQIAFMLFMAPIMGWMIFTGEASTPLVVAAATMVVLIIMAGITLRMALQDGPTQRSFCEMLPDRVADGIASLRSHSITPRNLASVLPHSLAINLLGTATMGFALWSVGVHPGLMTILMARVVATLAVILLPIWQGAGALELSVLGVLVAGGVSAPDAIAAIAIFRFAQFWIPLAIGGLAFLPRLKPASLVRVRTAAIASSVAGVLALVFLNR